MGSEQSSISPPDHLVVGRNSTTKCERPIAQSLDLPITRPTDSKDCRECLGALAHRLAQPMTALRGGIELGLMGKRPAGDYRSLLEQLLQLADNMAQLIVSMRDLGESSAACGPAQCIPLDAVAAEALAELRSEAESRGLRLLLKSEGGVRVCANQDRLREALQSLLAWVIQNSAGGDVIVMHLATSQAEGRIYLTPPRLDLQYLQVKILEDITNPGALISHAAKHGALGWAINQRLLEGLGGKLDILTEGPESGCIRMCLPSAPMS